MPLLKRKRLPPVELPEYDSSKKESRDLTVWYSPLTHEIFKDYSEYLKRVSLYRKPIWQCESTGKSNLTFTQALESEKTEKERVQDKLPEELQKRVLLRVLFQTARLDAVVDDVYQYFSNRFVVGEHVNCIWDDGIAYNAEILEALSETEDEEQSYKVQLIDENSNGIADCVGTVSQSKLKRDRLAFSKNFLKKYIKEYTVKDTYIGAPWTIRPDIAKRFDIDNTLPDKLQQAKDLAYSKSRKKRLQQQQQQQQQQQSNNESNSTNGTVQAPEKPVVIDARKLEATLKYPMEDLNLPSYRRDPSGFGKIMNMVAGSPDFDSIVQNPTSGHGQRPAPITMTTIPQDCHGIFLMIWCFLGVFSRPLRLTPFSLDDFESALSYQEGISNIIVESNATLLNAIIVQRNRLKKESQGHGSMALAAAQALYGTGYQSCKGVSLLPSHFQKEETPTDEDDIWSIDSGNNNKEIQHKKRVSNVERGCASAAVEKIGEKWDSGFISADSEREGWVDVLIGFLNQLAPIELLSEIDRILNQLVPSSESTLEDREDAYASLSIKDKLAIYELLVNVANESQAIKTYMEECQEQLTELRKQKIELSRERRRIHAERVELERQQEESDDKKAEEEQQQQQQLQQEQSQTEEDEESGDSDNDEEDALRKAQRETEQMSRHESRQAAMKRRQMEREEREAKRLKMHHLQREEARIRNQEMKARNDIRKKLDEDERTMHKKEDQIERDMRKFSTHRIRPLGRDKFYNRYYYLDDIGGMMTHGSGKLFVQSPSGSDLMLLQERDVPEEEDMSSLPCGRGGGVDFVGQLMKAQGFEQEFTFVKETLAQSTTTVEWWQYYDKPEDIEKLLDWLNPKGIREYRLKREIEKCFHYLLTGMKKHNVDQQVSVKHDVGRRNTRSRNAPQFSQGSWNSYINKLAK